MLTRKHLRRTSCIIQSIISRLLLHNMLWITDLKHNKSSVNPQKHFIDPGLTRYKKTQPFIFKSESFKTQ